MPYGTNAAALSAPAGGYGLSVAPPSFSQGPEPASYSSGPVGVQVYDQPSPSYSVGPPSFGGFGPLGEVSDPNQGAGVGKSSYGPGVLGGLLSVGQSLALNASSPLGIAATVGQEMGVVPTFSDVTSAIGIGGSGLSPSDADDIDITMGGAGGTAGPSGSSIDTGFGSLDMEAPSFADDEGYGGDADADGGDSVLCTALRDHGLISAEMYIADAAHGAKMPADVVAGYHAWAKPIARLMNRSRALAVILIPLIIPWAVEVAHREGFGERGHWLGKVYMAVGVPICRFIGRRRNFAKAA